MPIINGKHFPYTQKGKQAAMKAMVKHSRTMPDGPVAGEKVVRKIMPKAKPKYRMTDGGKMKY